MKINLSVSLYIYEMSNKCLFGMPGVFRCKGSKTSIEKLIKAFPESAKCTLIPVYTWGSLGELEESKCEVEAVIYYDSYRTKIQVNGDELLILDK